MSHSWDGLGGDSFSSSAHRPRRGQAHRPHCQSFQHCLDAQEELSPIRSPPQTHRQLASSTREPLEDVTQTVAEVDDSLKELTSKKTDRSSSNMVEYSYDEDPPKKSSSRAASRSTSSGHDMLSRKAAQHHEEWHTDLLACCSEPSLCLKTFFFPCGTLAKIATAATNRHMSSAEACNELMAYSLILSCCCYTCCVRRKLRKTLNITLHFLQNHSSNYHAMIWNGRVH